MATRFRSSAPPNLTRSPTCRLPPTCYSSGGASTEIAADRDQGRAQRAAVQTGRSGRVPVLQA